MTHTFPIQKDIISVGMIGCGARGSMLMDTLSAIDDVRIVAVCDKYEDRVTRAIAKQERLRGNTPVGTQDYREILAMDEVDAVVTHRKGFCLCVSTADCVPIIIYDKVKEVIAAVHAGWRGTVERIVEKTLDVMKSYYGTEGKDVVACIGPSISLESFEVGNEVYAAFEEAGFDMARIARRYEKWHLDLWEANLLQLLAHGVLPEHIEVADICTYQHHGDFFSARRLGIQSGRILSGIVMNEMIKQ